MQRREMHGCVARVPTDDQDLSLLADTPGTDSCELLFEDMTKGFKTERTKLLEATDFHRPGVILVVWRLGELGRSLSVEKPRDAMRRRSWLDERVLEDLARGVLARHNASGQALADREIEHECPAKRADDEETGQRRR